MNRTLLTELIHAIHAISDRSHPSTSPNQSPKRPALRRRRLLTIRVTNALSALVATPHAFACDVAHTLRCHYITTTKLSKNTQPTHCLNWRNTHSSNPSETCQQLREAFGENSFGFFSRLPSRFLAGYPAIAATRHRGVPNALLIISARGRMTTHPKIAECSCGSLLHKLLRRQ
jgi:hypothetical protein